MAQQLLADVEAKLERLIQRYQQLEAENRALRQKEQDWLHERSRLLEKNEVASTRLESLITRLKQLEPNSE